MSAPDNSGEKGDSTTRSRSAWRNWGDHPAVVVATIVAAIAGVLSAYYQVKQRTPADDSVARAETECADVTVRWTWHTTGGVVSIAPGGTIEWYRLATDPTPLINGTWECNAKVNPRHFTFRWFQTNFVDTLVVSSNGETMGGATTNNGFRLSGSRLR